MTTTAEKSHRRRPRQRPAAPTSPTGDPRTTSSGSASARKIAYRNLVLSVPALLCGFAVWGMWGIITVQMLNLGYPFTQAELFTLTAIAGIAGATMRIPASFLIRVAGGRNTIFLTTAMLLAPAIGTGIVLQHKDWPLWSFQLMALWSGVGGGNFASSMSNISTFFPKRLQGTALGINAGIGNFGVTSMQIVIPLMMTMGIFGALGGEPMTLVKDSGWIFGKIPAGTPTWIQNAGFAWVLSLVPLSILCWLGMNNLKTVSPDTGNPIAAFAKITWLYTLAFIPSILGLYLYLPKPTGLGVISMWVAIPLDVVAALLVMRLAAFGPMKEGVAKQFAIFRNKHTWSMTAALHRHVRLVHRLLDGAAAVDEGDLRRQPRAAMRRACCSTRLNNPNAPAILAYAWIGPFVGALIRPVGGWISDKVGGSIVTQVISVVMVVASVAVGYVMLQAYQSPAPEQYFLVFMLLFVLLFAASGIGNGSTFRTIGVIFDRTQAGPVLGWTSAIAAYGAFVAPIVIGAQISAGTPQYAMYGFAIFYGAVPDPQLVVLPAPQRVREESVNGSPAERHDEPFSRSPESFLAPEGDRSPTVTGLPPARTAPGKTPTATAGRTTRSCAAPTASTARARARGRSTSRAASSPGRRSRPTTRARAGTCRTTNRAAARAARPTAGICTARTASSIRWCAAACSSTGARHGCSTARWRRGRPSSRTMRSGATTSRCAAWAASCARAGTRSTRSSLPPTSTRPRPTGPTA